MLQLVLSPYETARTSEAACAAAMLGAERGGVLVLRPAPPESGGAEAARELASRSPMFSRLLDRWRWAGSLWKTGVFRSAVDGDDLPRAMARAHAEMLADPAFSSARPLLKNAPFEQPNRLIETLSAEILRGGADPAFTLPLLSAVELLAVASESPIVMGDASGAIWKSRTAAAPAWSFSFPMLIDADSAELLHFREELVEPLDRLRSALVSAINALRAGHTEGRTDVRLAAEAYAKEFGRAIEASPARSGKPLITTVSASMSYTGKAARLAASRMSRFASPVAVEAPPAASLGKAQRPIVLLRVRASGWDYATSGSGR